MTKKKFYVEDYFIQTKNKDNWKSIKGMLDLPIRKNPTRKSQSDDYEDKLKEIEKKKGLRGEARKEEIKKLKEKKFEEELNKVRITHGVFLRAIGNLICDKGDPPGLSAPSIKSKFETLAEKGYGLFSEKLITRIKNGEFEDIRIKPIKECEKIIEEAKERDLKELKGMNNGRGIIVANEIDSLNRWLNNNHPAVFIKKVGENYKLLVYQAEGIEGETEYFCSDKNRDKFIEIVDKNKRDIQTLKNKFESIAGLRTLEEVLEPPPQREREFFPIGGPYNYNFINEWIVRRPEVSNVIMNIDEDFNKVQFLVGDSATGKTVIVRNVGYELLEKGWRVYQISAYGFNRDQISTILHGLNYFESISNKALIIFEDVHEDSSNFFHLLYRLTKHDLKTRFLLTGRKSYDIFLTQEKKNIFKKCEIIELKEEWLSSVADSIISYYVQNQKDKSGGDFDKLTSDLRDEMIEIADGNFWILAYLLKSWDPGKGIDIKNVYDYIGADIEDLENEFLEEHNLTGVGTTLLTLSIFSMFDLRFADIFFNEVRGIINVNQATLKKLTKYGEISCIKGVRRKFYSIPHSALAELYVKTCIIGGNKKRYSYLLSPFTDILKENGFSGEIDNFLPEMLKLVMKFTPSSLIGLILKMPLFELKHRVVQNESKNVASIGQGDKVDRSVTLFKLFQDKSFLILLIDALNDRDNLAEVGAGLTTFSASTGMHYYEDILKNLDSEKLALKIEKNIDKRPQDVLLCIDGLCKGDIIEKEKLIDSFFSKLSRSTIEKAISYLNKSELTGHESIPFYLFIKDHGWNEKLINKALSAIKYTDDLNSVLVNIKIIENGVDLGIAKYVEIHKKGEEEIVKIIDFLKYHILTPDILLSKFRKNSIVTITTFFCLANEYMREKISKNKQFTDNLLPILISKINEEREFYYILLLITEISMAGKNGKEFASRIIDAINGEQWFIVRIKHAKNAGISYYLPYEKDDVQFVSKKMGIEENITIEP